MTHAERNKAEYDRIMRESAERVAKRRAMTDAEANAENQRIQDDDIRRMVDRKRRDRGSYALHGGAW